MLTLSLGATTRLGPAPARPARSAGGPTSRGWHAPSASVRSSGGWVPPAYPYWLAPPTQIVDCVRDPYDPINKCCPPDRVIDGRCALLVQQNPLHGALGLSSMTIGIGTVVVGVLGAFLVAKRLKQRR